MGRRIPPYTHASIHPAVSLSFLTAFVAATIVVIAALCGAKAKARSRSQKSNPLSSSSSTQNSTAANVDLAAKSPSPTKLAVETENPPEDEQELPSILTQKTDDTSESFTGKRQRRKLSASLSVKAGGMALARMLSRKDEKQSKTEDSIWTKKILLGEKCRVPDEDDEDAIIYDERGNRLSSYPSKTTSSVPVSRSNSFIDRNSHLS